MRKDGEKALPLSGHRPSAAARSSRCDRDCEDHVYCVFEFPGPDYEERPQQEDRRHLLVDQRQRLRRLRRDRDGHQGHADPGARAGSACSSSDCATPRPASGVKAAKEGSPTLDTTAQRRRRRGHRQDGAWRRPGQPRLHRGDGALGLVHPQSRSREPAPLPSQGGPGRRRDRADDQHRHPREPPHRVQEEWFDIDSDETPEGVKPDVAV